MYVCVCVCVCDQPTTQATVVPAGKNNVDTPARDGEVAVMKPEFLARMEAQGEYIAGGRVFNPDGSPSRAIDPNAFNYYKKSTLAPPTLPGRQAGKVKAWQHRGGSVARPINQKAFQPAALAGTMSKPTTQLSPARPSLTDDTSVEGGAAAN